MPETAYFAVAEWAAFAGYGSTASTVLGAAAYVGTAVAISYVAQEIMAPSANKSAGGISSVSSQGVSNAQGVIGGAAASTTIRQSAAPRRLIYGRVKTGGVLVYAKKTPNEYDLHLACYLGEGPIEGIEPEVYLGDRNSGEAQYSGLVSAEVFTGAAGQTYSASLAAVSEGEWTSDMVGNGCAWVHTTYTFDKEKWDLGPVMPAFIVKGRLCYDPRSETTPAVSTSNAALCILDFIRSPYGYGFKDSAIDFDSFAVAANICAQVVDSVDPENTVAGVPSKVRRYGINGVFDVDVGPKKTVEAMLACCAGVLVRSGGKWRLYVGAYRAPTGPQLTGEYLRDAPTYRAFPARQQRYNIARGTYREPKQDWQDTSIHDQILSAAIVAEDGEIVQSVDLPAVTISAQAQRLARLYMNLARSAVPMVLRCNYAALQWAPYDVVDVAIPEVGADGPFLITKMDYIDPSEGGGLDLTLVPHLASDYAWDHTTHEKIVETVEAPNMDFPVPAATGMAVLSIGTAFYNGSDQVDRTVTFAWDEPDWAMLSYYELQIKEGTGEWVTYQVAETQWSIDASPDLSYSARFRNVGLDDRKSDWSGTATVSVYRDTSTAGAGTGISVTSGAGHTIAWTNPSDDNFSRMRLLTVSGPGLGSPNIIATLPGRPGTPQSITTAYPAGTHYALQSETVDGEGGTIVYAGEGTTDTSALLAEQLDPINTTLTDLEDRVVTLESA